MKVSWGNKLFIFFIIFGISMGTLVYKCFQTNYDLVSKEYYKDELAYQQVIDGSVHASSREFEIVIRQANGETEIFFPGSLHDKIVSGSTLFYFPQDAKHDFKVTLDKGDDTVQIVKHEFYPGNYVAKISWSVDGKPYYTEQAINLK